MKLRFASVAVLLAAMLMALLAAVELVQREFSARPAQPVDPMHVLRAPHPLPHADLSGPACPAFPHGVSPRPTLPAKAVIRT